MAIRYSSTSDDTITTHTWFPASLTQFQPLPIIEVTFDGEHATIKFNLKLVKKEVIEEIVKTLYEKVAKDEHTT